MNKRIAAPQEGGYKANEIPKSTLMNIQQTEPGNEITMLWFCGESDEPIVVMKWGNVHGAKGLYCKYVLI